MALLINPNIIVGLGFMISLSVIDFLTYNKKKGYIPSIFTTLFLIIMFILGGYMALFLGVFAGLISLLFTDLDLWGGIADLKVFVAGAMAFPNPLAMLIFAVLVTICAFAVKSFVYFRITKHKKAQIPFIPIMLIAYVIAWLLNSTL